MHAAIHLRVDLLTLGPLVDEPEELPIRLEGACPLRPAQPPPALSEGPAQQPVEEVVEEPDGDRSETVVGVELDDGTVALEPSARTGRGK